MALTLRLVLDNPDDLTALRFANLFTLTKIDATTLQVRKDEVTKVIEYLLSRNIPFGISSD